MAPDFILQEYVDDLSVCDDIIEFHTNSSEKRPGTTVSSQGHVVDKTVKDSVDVALSGDVAAKYFEQLQGVAYKYVAKYPQCNMYAPWGIVCLPMVQMYPPNGGYFQWHTERVCATDPIVASRHLVFMTYLNDVTDGGETEFALQGVKVRPKKGLTLIWPADWTHTHRGLPSSTQTKYIVTGWFNFTQ